MHDEVGEIFKDLDVIFKPIGIPKEAYSLIFKPYTNSVEKFLKNAKLRMMELSWLQVFHKRMLHTKQLLPQNRFTQYVEVMEFYVELVCGAEKPAKHEQSKQLALIFLAFLYTHEMDTDSSLLGLAPSDYTVKECTMLEKNLRLKLMNIKKVSHRQTKKSLLFSLIGEEITSSPPPAPSATSSQQMSRDNSAATIPSVTPLGVWEWIIEKGDIVIIRNTTGLCFTRYTGVHTAGYKSFTVWTDASETITENVPWTDFYLLTPALRKIIFSRDAEAIQKLVSDPNLKLYRTLRKKTKQIVYGYLNTHGVNVELMVSVEDSSIAYTRDLVQIAKLLNQLAHFVLNTPPELYELAECKARKKTQQYISQFGRLTYLPRQFQPEKLFEFANDIKTIANYYLVLIHKTVKEAFDNICREYLNGNRMDALNDWILIHCENCVTRYLEDVIQYDFAVVPENYLVEPPSSLPEVKKNITKLEVLLRNKVKMQELVDEVCAEIKLHVFNFFARCYIALSAEFLLPCDGVPLTVENNTTAAYDLVRCTLTQAALPPHITEERRKYLENYVTDLKVLLEMTEERPSTSPVNRDVNKVSYGGLVVSPIVRLLEECKSSYEYWETRTKDQPSNLSREDNNINTTIMQFFGVNNKPPASLLYEAVAANNLSLVFQIIASESYDVEYQDQHGWTPIHLAAYNVAKKKNDFVPLEILQFILALPNLNASVCTHTMSNALHILAATPATYHDNFGLAAALEMLRIKGASVFQLNMQQELPIHIASVYGNIVIMEFLLKTGCNVNSVTKSNQSCLHSAIHSNNLEAVKLLISYGANPSLPNGDGGTTPIDLATSMNLTDIVDYLNKYVSS